MENSTVVSFLSGIKPTPWLLSVTQLIFFTHNWLKLVWLLRSHEEVYYLQHKQMHLQKKSVTTSSSSPLCLAKVSFTREWENDNMHQLLLSKPYKYGRCIWKENTRIFHCHTPIQHTPDRHTEWENAFCQMIILACIQIQLSVSLLFCALCKTWYSSLTTTPLSCTLSLWFLLKRPPPPFPPLSSRGFRLKACQSHPSLVSCECVSVVLHLYFNSNS